MLEGRNLLLRPWAPEPAPPGVAAGPGLVRAILDGDSEKLLGFARRYQPPAPSWLLWLAPPWVEVYEAGDEPLLCTVHGLWGLGPLWEVRDADGRRVATVGRSRIRNRQGRDVALRASLPDGSAVWRGRADGRELARAALSPRGLRLHFADAVAEEPLVKMALLGAALVLTPPPRGQGG